MDYEVLIVGGGVIGLACAKKISGMGKSVLLIERHPSFGWETSSRNSEVIHAGIYYPKDSLKAKLCVPGNHDLYKWCEKSNVPFSRCGKFIVAVDNTEDEELESILARALNNGVSNIFRIGKVTINENEPYIKAESALWSQNTGVIDSHKLMESLENLAMEHGCDFAWKHTLNNIEKIPGGYQAEILDPENETVTINVEKIVNAAGLDSDIVARMAGIDIDEAGYRLNYCRGHYFRVKSSKKHLAKRLIYPVPNKNIQGLGIHVTLDMNGELKLGPDTQYLDNRIQDYSVSETLGEKFYRAASRYLSGLELDDIYPDQSGIRPKLQVEGGPFRDFVINEESSRGFPGFVNLIGIESPGLTCCLQIADMVNDFVN